MLNKLTKFLTKPGLMARIWKKIQSFFFIEQWIILGARSNAGFENLQWDDFHPIIPPPDRDWADPFPWFQQGRHYIFIEEKPYSTNIGRIICLTLDENFNITSQQVIIETPYHLSYPFLFEYEGQLYMMPESNANSTVDLYRCVKFPGQWEFVRTLLPDIRAVDATLLQKDNQWWMFANVFEPGGSSWKSLHIFTAANPITGPWLPHPANPVIEDVNRARPAGHFLLKDGVIIRPSQDCSIRYGYATNFNRIEHLDANSYRESLVHVIKPPADTAYRAVHTWNETNGLTMIDAIYRRRRPLRIFGLRF